MDPLSITASAVALITVAGTVSSPAYLDRGAEWQVLDSNQ